MKTANKILLKSAVILYTATIISCSNDIKQVKDFLALKNLPISVAKDVVHVYKDSGRITSKLTTPLLYNFSNRKEHPYDEFPKGLKIINFGKKDTITIMGNYALSYKKTSISEIVGNVIVINQTDKSKLETDQLFWDQNTNYFFSEKAFKLSKITDTIFGVGFECEEILSKYLAKKTTGNLETEEDL